MFDTHDQKLIFLAFVAVFVSYCPLFGVLGQFTRNMTICTCLRGMTKNSSFYVLGPFSWAIVHSFGFLRWFTRPMTLSLSLRGTTKNMSFLHFWAVSWGIVHSFGFLGWFSWSMTLSTCLTVMTKNSLFLRLWPFREELSIVLGFWGDLHGPWHSVHVWEAWPKTCRFTFLSRFREL
jgi:hypothetical protein